MVLASFLCPPAARRRDFARAHEIANVFLQELVVAVQLVVLLLDGLDAVEDHDERVLERLGVSPEFFPGLSPHGLNVLGRPSRTHGADVVRVEVDLVGLVGIDGVSRHHHGAAAFPAR